MSHMSANLFFLIIDIVYSSFKQEQVNALRLADGDFGVGDLRLSAGDLAVEIVTLDLSAELKKY